MSKNINFKIDKESGKTALDLAFTKTMFQRKAYCINKGLDLASFNKVMAGKLTGQKQTPRSGNARKVILQLKEDGIWAGELTWSV